ncbi:MAG TPA: SMR family transporter [Caldimonas sp.]|nr:SMR family transporter [Caldimonas sp.]
MTGRYLQLGLAVAFNVGAYAVFKSIAARQHDALWFSLFAAGLALGAVNTFFFTDAMKEIPLSVAYPLFSGASVALVVLLSAVAFAEKVTAANLAGSAAVVLGIVLLTR